MITHDDVELMVKSSISKRNVDASALQYARTLADSLCKRNGLKPFKEVYTKMDKEGYSVLHFQRYWQ